MSIIKTVENIELERENNKTLGQGIDEREASSIAEDEAELALLENLVENKRRRLEDRKKRREVIRTEFADRDEALRVIIEGDNAAE